MHILTAKCDFSASSSNVGLPDFKYYYLSYRMMPRGQFFASFSMLILSHPSWIVEARPHPFEPVGTADQLKCSHLLTDSIELRIVNKRRLSLPYRPSYTQEAECPSYLIVANPSTKVAHCADTPFVAITCSLPTDTMFTKV